eukprot:3326196-Pyramimonas_sp.AAC.1
MQSAHGQNKIVGKAMEQAVSAPSPPSKSEGCAAGPEWTSSKKAAEEDEDEDDEEDEGALDLLSMLAGEGDEPTLKRSRTAAA